MCKMTLVYNYDYYVKDVKVHSYATVFQQIS